MNAKIIRNYYAGKKVLVTGDTGFKGSWLSLWLSHLGAHVYGIGLPPQSKGDNFVLCELDSLILHKMLDICDHHTLYDYVQNISPDIVFHLAAQPLVRLSYEIPRETMQTNVMGTVHILEAVRNTPSITTAIMVTSDKCYENKEWMHGYRECDEMGGYDPYSASKGAAEIVIRSYLHSYFDDSSSAHIASVRAGNVIGAGDLSLDRIIPDCIRSIRGGNSLTIRNPHALRPWQHVLEPLSGYLLLGALLGMNYSNSSCSEEKQQLCGAWNFGPRYENIVPVEQIVRMFFAIAGSGTYQVSSSANLHEASTLALDIAKSVLLLKWSPVLDIQETLKWTWDGYNVEKSGEPIRAHRIQQIEEYMHRMDAVTSQ
jgi:CDP-glucose 4,6-dehydratase